MIHLIDNKTDTNFSLSFEIIHFESRCVFYRIVKSNLSSIRKQFKSTPYTLNVVEDFHNIQRQCFF